MTTIHSRFPVQLTKLGYSISINGLIFQIFTRVTGMKSKYIVRNFARVDATKLIVIIADWLERMAREVWANSEVNCMVFIHLNVFSFSYQLDLFLTIFQAVVLKKARVPLSESSWVTLSAPLSGEWRLSRSAVIPCIWWSCLLPKLWLGSMKYSWRPRWRLQQERN